MTQMAQEHILIKLQRLEGLNDQIRVSIVDETSNGATGKSNTYKTWKFRTNCQPISTQMFTLETLDHYTYTVIGYVMVILFLNPFVHTPHF